MQDADATARESASSTKDEETNSSQKEINRPEDSQNGVLSAPSHNHDMLISRTSRIDDSDYRSIPSAPSTTQEADIIDNESDPVFRGNEQSSNQMNSSIPSRSSNQLQNLMDAPNECSNPGVSVDGLCSDLNLEMNHDSSVPRVFLCGVPTTQDHEKDKKWSLLDDSSTTALSEDFSVSDALHSECTLPPVTKPSYQLCEASNKKLKRRVKLKRKMKILKRLRQTSSSKVNFMIIMVKMFSSKLHECIFIIHVRALYDTSPIKIFLQINKN